MIFCESAGCSTFIQCYKVFFYYVFYNYLKHKGTYYEARLKPEILSISSRNPTRKARADLQVWFIMFFATRFLISVLYHNTAIAS